MARDGGELGRGLCRNIAALQSSIEHLWIKHDILKQAGQPLDHVLEGMPQEVTSDLVALHRAISEILAR